MNIRLAFSRNFNIRICTEHWTTNRSRCNFSSYFLSSYKFYMWNTIKTVIHLSLATCFFISFQLNISGNGIVVFLHNFFFFSTCISVCCSKQQEKSRKQLIWFVVVVICNLIGCFFLFFSLATYVLLLSGYVTRLWYFYIRFRNSIYFLLFLK